MEKKYVILVAVLLILITFSLINTAKFLFSNDKTITGFQNISLQNNSSDIFNKTNNQKDLLNTTNNTTIEEENNEKKENNNSILENDIESSDNVSEETVSISETGSNSPQGEQMGDANENNNFISENQAEIINNNITEETGMVSGRILYDPILLKPVYNASVLVNGKPAEIYGTTFLATNVSSGEIIIEAEDSSGKKINETLTVEPFALNSVDLIFPAFEEGMPPEIIITSDYLRLNWKNGLIIKLNITQDRLLGLGEVNIDGIPLRKSSLTGLPKIFKIENGYFDIIKYSKCQFIVCETKGDAVIVHSNLITEEGDIELDWIFSPWQLKVEDTMYKGLAYRFSISSPINISKMEFKCSWELNQNINGKTLLTRREKTEWERECNQSGEFSIFTSSLLCQSQPPDYQYDVSGALASFIWPPAQLENTLHKDNKSDQLSFSDRYLFGETKHANTSFRIVLYSDKKGVDEYTYLLDKISNDYRIFYELEEVEPIPTVLARNYLQDGVRIGYAPPYRDVANNQLIEFANQNFKQLNILSVWISNGRIGEPFNGNRLATHSIDVYPDDIDELKYFINKTHDLDMKFTVWLSSCYSIESPLYEANEWQIKDVNNDFYTANSGDVYLMSYKSGYLAYSLNKLKDIQKEFEFDGIWHDSFTIGGSIDYSDVKIGPCIDQQMQFLSATQQMGYSPYLESLGPFGMTSIGSIFVTPPESPGGDRDIDYAFGGKEYLAYKTSFTLWHIDDYYPLQIEYYRYLANKACPMINHAYLNETEKNEISQANKDYNAVLSYMDKRSVLFNNSGILWYDRESNTQILFSYTEFSYNTDSEITRVFDITNNTVQEIINGSFLTQQNHTYLLQ